MHFFDANLQHFAKVLKKFNVYGVRSYAKVDDWALSLVCMKDGREMYLLLTFTKCFTRSQLRYIF